MMLKIVNIYPCDKLLKKKIFTYLAFQIPYKTILSVLISRISLKTIYTMNNLHSLHTWLSRSFLSYFRSNRLQNHFVTIYIHWNITTGKIINTSFKRRDIYIVEFYVCILRDDRMQKKRSIIVLEIKQNNQTKSSGVFYISITSS